MTLRQRKFVRAYLAGPIGVRGIAMRAAEVAGYGVASSAVGNQLVTHPAIREKIRRHLAHLDITTDRVLEEMRRIGFSDMRNYATWDGGTVTLKPSGELTDEDAAAVAEVQQVETKEGGSIKFKLHDKRAALQDLGKFLGMFTERDQTPKQIINVAVILEQPAGTNGRALPGIRLELEDGKA